MYLRVCADVTIIVTDYCLPPATHCSPWRRRNIQLPQSVHTKLDTNNFIKSTVFNKVLSEIFLVENSYSRICGTESTEGPFSHCILVFPFKSKSLVSRTALRSVSPSLPTLTHLTTLRRLCQ